MGALRDWALGRPDGTPWFDGGPVPALPAGPGPPSDLGEWCSGYAVDPQWI